MQVRETRYTRVGDVHVAYQVVGQGPDLLLVPLFVSHVDLIWTEPMLARFLMHTASFARLILFDMPGTGLSDRVTRVPTLDERVTIIEAVLDAAGSERAAICGTSEGGQAAMLFAATRPERTNALLLYGAYPRVPTAGDFVERLTEIGEDVTPERADEIQARVDRSLQHMETTVARWGEGLSIDLVATPPFSALQRRFWGVFERAAISPAGARAALDALHAFDVTDVLPAIRVPTLVMHPASDPAVPVESGRYLAAKIPGARFVETAGTHHGIGFGDIAAAVDEVERFLTGTASGWDPDRAFMTVVFTDIVDSTRLATQLGDARWRGVLEEHDAQVERLVDDADGNIVKRTGDGFLLTFDNATAAVRCADAIASGAVASGLRIRAGVHSGECELMVHDLAGLAVHIGARVAALAGPGEVLVSRRVKELVVGSGIEMIDRGTHHLKGVSEPWQVFAARTDGSAAVDGLRAAPADRLARQDRTAVALARRAPAFARAMYAASRWRPGGRRTRATAG